MLFKKTAIPLIITFLIYEYQLNNQVCWGTQNILLSLKSNIVYLLYVSQSDNSLG